MKNNSSTIITSILSQPRCEACQESVTNLCSYHQEQAHEAFKKKLKQAKWIETAIKTAQTRIN